MPRSFVAVMALISTASFVLAQGGSVDERLRRLEEENRRILEALERSNVRNTELEVQVADLKDSASKSFEVDPLEVQINNLSAMIQDSGWTSATKSGKSLRFYGFLRQDGYYNDSKAGIDPVLTFFANPEVDGDGVENNDDDFVFETRLVRFGFDVDAGKIGSADVTGKLEIDFANFVLLRESRQTPRIRLAYINIDFGDITLRFGQDWDVISPLYPQVHNEILLWGAGNVGDRRPQAQLIWEPESEGPISFKFQLSAGASGAVDGRNDDGAQNLFNDLDGYDSGHPHGQTRISMTFDTHVEEQRGTIGVWGYVAGIETSMRYNGEDHFTAWLVGIDVEVPVFDFLVFRGEAWVGQALSDVRGNILHSLNTVAGKEIGGWGGWAELRFQVTADLLFVLGGSIDDTDNDDLAVGQRALNWTTSVGARHHWGGGLYTGLELIYFQTRYQGGADGDILRSAAYIMLTF